MSKALQFALLGMLALSLVSATRLSRTQESLEAPPGIAQADPKQASHDIPRRTALEVSHALEAAGPAITIKWSGQVAPGVLCVQIEQCDSAGSVPSRELPLPIPLQGFVFGFPLAGADGEVVLRLSDVGLHDQHFQNVRVSAYTGTSLMAVVRRPAPEDDGRGGHDKLLTTNDVTFKNAVTAVPFWMSPREQDCVKICPSAGKLLTVYVPEGAVSEVEQPTSHGAFVAHFFSLPVPKR